MPTYYGSAVAMWCAVCERTYAQYPHMRRIRRADGQIAFIHAPAQPGDTATDTHHLTHEQRRRGPFPHRGASSWGN